MMRYTLNITSGYKTNEISASCDVHAGKTWGIKILLS